jgi:hypothetical protein
MGMMAGELSLEIKIGNSGLMGNARHPYDIYGE